jgi:hypothetical protein
VIAGVRVDVEVHVPGEQLDQLADERCRFAGLLHRFVERRLDRAARLDDLDLDGRFQLAGGPSGAAALVAVVAFDQIAERGRGLVFERLGRAVVAGAHDVFLAAPDAAWIDQPGERGDDVRAGAAEPFARHHLPEGVVGGECLLDAGLRVGVALAVGRGRERDLDRGRRRRGAQRDRLGRGRERDLEPGRRRGGGRPGGWRGPSR